MAGEFWSAGSGSTAGPGFRFDSDPDTGLYLAAVGDQRACVTSQDVARFTTTGLQALIGLLAGAATDVNLGRIVKMYTMTATFTQTLAAGATSTNIQIGLTGLPGTGAGTNAWFLLASVDTPSSWGGSASGYNCWATLRGSAPNTADIWIKNNTAISLTWTSATARLVAIQFG